MTNIIQWLMALNSYSLVDLVACSNLDPSFDKTDHVLILEERQRGTKLHFI